jgi:hypothetical protein
MPSISRSSVLYLEAELVETGIEFVVVGQSDGRFRGQFGQQLRGELMQMPVRASQRGECRVVAQGRRRLLVNHIPRQQ